MYVLLRRNLSKYLVPPFTEKVFIDESISDCLPHQPPSFSFGKMWRWFSCFQKTQNIMKGFPSLYLRLLELDSSYCDILQALTCQCICFLIVSPPHIVYLTVLNLSKQAFNLSKLGSKPVTFAGPNTLNLFYN